ncbi:hypothetical protein [Moraxella lacunata]|uniref:hypothetical protein n=1 Tax=Moraxella lacunata TaxID=477 RepID=UPI0011C036FE|nr:hypothetical protein [Moraxella lacunata]
MIGVSLGSELSCVPVGVLSKVNENTRDSILFYQTQRKIKNKTADEVDNFLYAKMIWKEKDWLQSAHKINPSIPEDKLVDFYLEQSANMGYREAIGSYANKLASDGTQEFIRGSHDKANQMYKQALSQVKTLIINDCKINSDIDIWSDFYTYKDRMGKVDKRLLDELFFVRQMVKDEYSYEPHNDENIKQATFIYMYDLINCNHIMQNNGGVNDYIPDTYERFLMHRNEKSRVLLYALEIVTKKDLNLPKPTNESDIQKEQILKERAMAFAQEYQNEFLKGK